TGQAGAGERRLPAGLGWFVNAEGQTFSVVPGPVEFLMGSPRTDAEREGGGAGRLETLHKRRIGRTFAIATREVTLAQFLRFRKDHQPDREFVPSVDCPVNMVTWYDAAAYCNWLSEREGLPRDQWCYEPNDRGEFADGMRLVPNFLERTGYRLPTEAEWETACRSESRSHRYYGQTDDLLGRYAWYTKYSLDRWMLPVGSLKPNDLGLFDMQGNATEWTLDAAAPYSD